MVICPIALAVHCTGCPFVKFCPAKTVLGDYGKESDKADSAQADSGSASEADEGGGDAGASAR